MIDNDFPIGFFLIVIKISVSSNEIKLRYTLDFFFVCLFYFKTVTEDF